LHSAEAAYFEVSGNGNYTCAVNLKRKTTPCADLEGCSKTNKAVAVCKGKSKELFELLYVNMHVPQQRLVQTP